MLAIGRKDFTATKFTKICSDHFVYEDFKLNVGGSYRLDLRENVIPSVFTCTTELLAKRAKLLNPTNSDTPNTSNLTPLRSPTSELEPLYLAPLRSPSLANLKEIDTPTTSTMSRV